MNLIYNTVHNKLEFLADFGSGVFYGKLVSFCKNRHAQMFFYEL